MFVYSGNKTYILPISNIILYRLLYFSLNNTLLVIKKLLFFP